jgi:uncharacterized protein (TIGR02118 family)
VYKIMGMFRFQSGIDKTEARRYWADVHGPLITKFPGLIAYSQSDPLERLSGDDGVSAEEEDYDAFIAHWYPDRETFEAATQSDEWARADADGARFVDESSAVVAGVEERIIQEGPRGGFKSLWIARFIPEKSAQEAGDYWTNEHGPLTLEAGGFTRYVQNHTLEFFTPVSAEKPGFDGLAEHWFTDPQAYRDVIGSPEWEGLGADGVNFLDSGRSWGVSIVERFLKDFS